LVWAIHDLILEPRALRAAPKVRSLR